MLKKKRRAHAPSSQNQAHICHFQIWNHGQHFASHQSPSTVIAQHFSHQRVNASIESTMLLLAGVPAEKAAVLNPDFHHLNQVENIFPASVPESFLRIEYNYSFSICLEKIAPANSK